MHTEKTSYKIYDTSDLYTVKAPKHAPHQHEKLNLSVKQQKLTFSKRSNEVH